MKAYHGTAVLKFDDDTTGNAASGASVTVRVNSSQALATIFDVDDIGVANPLTADANGNYAFKAADNIYDIIIQEGTPDEVKLHKVEIAEIPIPSGLINDLSQAYEFKTLNDAVISTANFPSGKVVHIKESMLGCGGGSIWDIVETSSVTPDSWVVVQSSGVPALSLVIRVDEHLSAKSIGITETGNFDAAFTAIETNHTGILVDLDGLSVTVTDEYVGNQYYNGSFITSTETIVLPKSPIASPFSYVNAGVHYVDPQPNTYRGLNVAQFPRTDGQMCYLWRDAVGHGNENPGSELLSFITKDHGFTLNPPTGSGQSGFKYAQAYRSGIGISAISTL